MTENLSDICPECQTGVLEYLYTSHDVDDDTDTQCDVYRCNDCGASIWDDCVAWPLDPFNGYFDQESD